MAARRDHDISGEREAHEAQDHAVAAAVAAMAFASAGRGRDVPVAFQGDLKSLDPYSLNETFTHRRASAT